MEAANGMEDVVLDISHPEEASSSNTQLGSSPRNGKIKGLENPGRRVQVSLISPPSDGIPRRAPKPNIPPPPVKGPKKPPEKMTRLISERKSRLVENKPQPAEEKEEPSPKWSKWTFPVAVLELNLSVCFLGCLGASLSSQVIKNYRIWGFESWKWCVLFMVIFCRAFIKLMMKDVILVIQRSSLHNEKFLDYVHALRRCVQIIVWFGCVFLAWWLLFDKAVRRSKGTTQILNYITRSLASLLIGAALWAVKTLVLEFLASSFQITRFFDRIQRSIIDQYILEVFSVCTELTKQSEKESVKRNKRIVRLMKNLQKQKVDEEEEEEVIDWLMKVEPGKLSSRKLKQLVKMITDSGLSGITSEVENFVREQDDKKITHDLEQKLIRVAYLIYNRLQNLRPRSNNTMYIHIWDLKNFFGNETELVLKHINGAAGTLFLSIKVLRDWLLLLLGFMFGNTAKSAFEGIVFVFVTNPFGEGDCCLMIVEQIIILTTVFRKNGKDTIVYPNCVLANLPIRIFYNGNLDVSDYVEFAIDSSTTTKQIRDIWKLK